MINKNTILSLVLLCTFFSCNKNTVTDANPSASFTQKDIAYGSDPLQKMDIYLPAGRTSATTKVMIMIHGGAWALGDKEDFDHFIDSFQRRLPGYAFFNINYRLATISGNVFPTQELDTKAAVEFIYNKRNEYFVSDKFVLLGGSAGSHLALLQAYKYQTAVKIKAVIDIFGPTNMNDLYDNPGAMSANDIAAVVGGTPTQIPDMYYQSSPINFVSRSAACPTIIFQGDADTLVNAARQSTTLYNALRTAGVPTVYRLYPGKDHGLNWDSETFFDAFNKADSFLATYNP